MARISPEIGAAWELAALVLKKSESAWWFSVTVGVPPRLDPKVTWSAWAAAGKSRSDAMAAQRKGRMRQVIGSFSWRLTPLARARISNRKWRHLFRATLR